MAAGSDVWLVDHAVTFGKAEELAQGLEADAGLLRRLAALMELPGKQSSALPAPAHKTLTLSPIKPASSVETLKDALLACR